MSEKGLRNLVFEILTDTFFLFPEKEITYIPDKLFEGSIRVEKKRLRFFLSKRLACMLAQNFLGEDIVSEDEIKESVKEFVNIIGGNYLSQIDKEAKLQLGFPEIKERKKEEIKDLKIEKFNIEGEFFGFKEE